MTNTATQPTEVTIERITKLMKSDFGVSLSTFEDKPIASANLNGIGCVFAILGSVTIVRAETATDITPADADASWYLAANDLNWASTGANAVILDTGPQLAVRTEAEIMSASGLNDTQLSSAIKGAVDAVLATHDAVHLKQKEMAKQFKG